jgi:hypothetical protein
MSKSQLKRRDFTSTATLMWTSLTVTFTYYMYEVLVRAQTVRCNAECLSQGGYRCRPPGESSKSSVFPNEAERRHCVKSS